MPTRSKWQRLETEAVNPRSRNIDRLSLGGMVAVMAADNRSILAAVQREKTRIARAAAMGRTSGDAQHG